MGFFFYFQNILGRRNCNHRVVNGPISMCDGEGVESDIPFNIDKSTVYMSLENFKIKVKF